MHHFGGDGESGLEYPTSVCEHENSLFLWIKFVFVSYYYKYYCLSIKNTTKTYSDLAPLSLYNYFPGASAPGVSQT